MSYYPPHVNPATPVKGVIREVDRITGAIEKDATEVFKADSVEELADKIGVDPAVLKANYTGLIINLNSSSLLLYCS